MSNVMCVIFVLIISQCGLAQTYESGASYKGTNDYITYHAGSLPLIISIPHGGYLEPDHIPKRLCIGCLTVMDTKTKELGLSVKERIKDISGCEVHVIVNELHRRKLDANREIVEAALGNTDAELAWTEYHAFIDSAKADVKRKWNRGLLIDLHGHGHAIQRLEMGYMVSDEELRKSDSELDARALDDLSIRTLISETDLTLSTALRGPESFGELFVDRGYDAVPSETVAAPAIGEPFYSGGYITDRYGSKDGSSIDAIQMECPRDVRYVDEIRERFADSIAVVILDFMQKYYDVNWPSGACQKTSIWESHEIEALHIFPNPVCGKLNVSLNEPIEQAMVYNKLGQVVRYSKEEDRIDLSSLPNGIYYLLVESASHRYRQRVSIRCN